MKHPRILVVEDDPSIREGLVDALKASSYEVLEADNAPLALRWIREEDFDFALLDVVLPGGSGWELLETLRKERATCPAVMLTAKGAESDKIKGLKLGADDYVVKPFSIWEVLARIEAVLRRSPERAQIPQQSLRLKEGYVHMLSRQVIFPESPSQVLTSKEFELLRHFAQHPGRLITREEILSRVWKMDPRLIETRSIDTTLARLREKLGPKNAALIQTLRSQGYLWQAQS